MEHGGGVGVAQQGREGGHITLKHVQVGVEVSRDDLGEEGGARGV